MDRKTNSSVTHLQINRPRPLQPSSFHPVTNTQPDSDNYSGFRPRCTHASVFLGSLRCKTGRCAPPPPDHRSFAAPLLRKAGGKTKNKILESVIVPFSSTIPSPLIPPSPRPPSRLQVGWIITGRTNQASLDWDRQTGSTSQNVNLELFLALWMIRPDNSRST